MNTDLLIMIATIGGTIIALIAFWSNNKKDSTKSAEELAVMRQTVIDSVKSIDHCHDKIRDLYSKNNESSVIIGKIQTTIEENTRVLRMIESAIINMVRLEEKVNGHIRESEQV